MIGVLGGIPVVNSTDKLDVIKGGVAEEVFANNIAGIAHDPDYDTIKVPLVFWDKEVGQLTLEV